ncbi:MAG: hypothetical protein M3066_13085 [Actinomycetota bacterium]|nr:hypothetical protein [Actinomycetota bacterium]
MPRLADRELEDLCRLAAVAEGRPVTVEEMKVERRAIARDPSVALDAALVLRREHAAR